MNRIEYHLCTTENKTTTKDIFFTFFLKTNTKVKRAAGCNLESITIDFFFFLQKVATKKLDDWLTLQFRTKQMIVI